MHYNICWYGWTHTPLAWPKQFECCLLENFVTACRSRKTTQMRASALPQVLLMPSASNGLTRTIPAPYGHEETSQRHDVISEPKRALSDPKIVVWGSVAGELS